MAGVNGQLPCDIPDISFARKVKEIRSRQKGSKVNAPEIKYFKGIVT